MGNSAENLLRPPERGTLQYAAFEDGRCPVCFGMLHKVKDCNYCFGSGHSVEYELAEALGIPYDASMTKLVKL